MAHEISITNGVASFADSQTDTSGRVDAWHKLGTPVGHAMTAQEALDAAHLANWNVRKVPLWTDLRGDEFYSGQGSAAVAVPSQFATVFNNPVTQKITPIGVVGTRYTEIQNESLTAFADALVDESGAHYQTAGSLRNYSQVFLTMKLPREMKLVGTDGKTDLTEWYLALFNSHDGSSAMFGVVTSTRVVCANTARAAIAGATSKFRVPHTSGWQGAVQIAREKLGLAWEYEEAFEAEARALFAQPFSNDDMKSFTEELTELAKVEKNSVAATKRQNEAGAILKLFVESPTIVGTPIAGTKYGAFNAVTEYVDHFAGVRGGGEDPAAARAVRTLSLVTAGRAAGEQEGFKADAWRLLTTN
jgi:phage/plasmid-like protein (TIGR03299 family)